MENLNHKKSDSRKNANVFILTAEKTLRKPGSDFTTWPCTPHTEKIEECCPKCGAPMLCAYADMGPVEYADVYNHICTNIHCDYVETKTLFGMTMGERDLRGPEICPLCHP